MAAQYKAKAKSTIGGGTSGNLNKDDSGAIKTIFTGYIMVAIIFFHAMGEPMPG